MTHLWYIRIMMIGSRVAQKAGSMRISSGTLAGTIEKEYFSPTGADKLVRSEPKGAGVPLCQYKKAEPSAEVRFLLS